MTRILVFIEATSVTGPAKNLLEFHRQQQSGGNAVHLEFATFQRGKPHDDFTRAVEAAGIPIHRIVERYAFDGRVFRQIHELLNRINPDIIQTHAIKSHFLLRLSGEWKRRPWIAFHHGYTFTSRRQLAYNQLDRWSLRRADRVVVVSLSFAKDLSKRGVASDRILVLHNAIDPAWGDRVRNAELRGASRARLGVRDYEKVVLIVGRLSLEKSHVQLVRAMAQLRSLLPDVAVRLLIVGDGPERQAIEHVAGAAGWLDRIVFAGYSPDVLPYYAAADLAVLASRTEGSPNALLEAMVARLPVVATSVGGIPEIATHEETALLVPPLDTAALASALTRALADPVAAEARAARAHAVILANYTLQGRAQRLCELYAETVAAGQKASG